MSPPPIQWYLARDGKQFGPLSEAELAKFIELGHLLPTDLLWREGFAEWRPAPSVFPPGTKPTAQPAPPRAEPAARPQPAAQQATTVAMQRPAQTLERREPAAQAVRQQPRPEEAPRQPLQPQMQPRAALQHAGLGGPRGGGPGGAGFNAPLAHSGPAAQPDYREFDDDADFEPGGKVLRRMVAVLLIAAVLGGAVYFGYPYRRHLMGLVGVGGEPGQKATIVSEQRGLNIPPLRGLEGSTAEVDANMQQAALWRIIKREFPEWYDARVAQIGELNARKTDQAEIAQQVAQALVLLRRQQINNALSASIPRLKLIATTFFDNLVQLRKTSDTACFEFIARGEASPLIVAMLRDSSPQTQPLQAQMAAVYEAIADGRKTPRAYPSPRREDYEALAADLTKTRGWTQADLQLFTDERALAQATPGKVCQLVHDWFAAQLDVKDPDTQVRLLVDSLKPVVAG
ncbi:MAG: DUF4339 domain-containing protein [Hyphomicrobiaceae bacterium]|nr:DUF4339 domain-containing protein [Hyphomicrobiaceae bacterium]